MHRLPASALPVAPRRLVLALATAAGLAACDKNPTRTAIAAEIAKGVHALRTKNVEEYLAQVPDEALGPMADGGQNPRDRIRGEILAAWSEIDTTRVLDITIDSVIPYGDSATVVTTMKWDRLIKIGTRRDTLVSNLRHREMWKKTPAGWRSIRLIKSIGETTRNGVRAG